MNTPSELISEQVGFEGPEKNLQVIFSSNNSSTSFSLRRVERPALDKMLSAAKCKILSSISNDFCTAYILSESSLFVYDDRIILKTCGTTPLLLAIDEILSIGKSCGLVPAAVLYWRKNFTHPENQLPPHQSFQTEVAFLEAHFGGYEASIVQTGPSNHDHWYFYYVEMCDKGEFKPVFPIFEIKMHEVHPDASRNFVWNGKQPSNEMMNAIRNIVPGMEIDEFLFDPCGYSMNGIDEEEYETIHITPEDECSYISFETSAGVVRTNRVKEYGVIELFRPASFTAIEITTQPMALKPMDVPGYKSVIPCTMSLMNGLFVTFWSYEALDIHLHPLAEIAALRRAKLWENSIAEEYGRCYSLGSGNDIFSKMMDSQSAIPSQVEI